jgi:hypothetical protein
MLCLEFLAAHVTLFETGLFVMPAKALCHTRESGHPDCRRGAVATLAAAGLTTEHKDVRDTAVRAQREGFDKAFISTNAWWAIGICREGPSQTLGGSY